MSADVDVTVAAPEEAAGFVAAMERVGFRLRIRDVEGFIARTRVLPFLHEATKLPLDVALAGPGLEELVLERTHEVDLAGRKISVISPEEPVPDSTKYFEPSGEPYMIEFAWILDPDGRKDRTLGAGRVEPRSLPSAGLRRGSGPEPMRPPMTIVSSLCRVIH